MKKYLLPVFSILAVLMFAFAMGGCEKDRYDYCNDVDVFINGRFSHTETECGYYY